MRAKQVLIAAVVALGVVIAYNAYQARTGAV